MAVNIEKQAARRVASAPYLNEVQARLAIILHDEYREVRVRLLYAVVEHAQQHVRVLSVVHHELLCLCDVAEAHAVHFVCVVEEEIAFAAELDHNPRRG